MEPPQERSTRAFVLGLDGVPWRLLHGWATAGELPNVARLLEEGAAGPLESTRPATTALAWPSIATGVQPDKHGIYDFQKLTPGYYRRMYSSEDVEQPELWSILSPALVGNVPMTYPAQPIDGTLFTGMMTPKLDDGFAHPPEFRTRFLDRIDDYEIGLDWSEYVGREEAFRSELSSLVERRRRAMELLMEDPDWRLFFFVYTAPDRLQHLVWDEDVILDHYRHLDDILGDVLSYVDDLDGTLYVVSDHGFGELSKFVAVNRALEDAELLARKRDGSVRSLLSNVGLSRDRVTDLLASVGITEQVLVDYLPEPLLQQAATRIPGDHALFDVDFERTSAMMAGIGGIHVNRTDRFDDGCVQPADVPAVKAAVTEALTSVTDPETGIAPLIVADGDDLFPADDASPDLVVTSKTEYEIAPDLKDDVVSPAEDKVASHRSEGIFLAWGPNVEPGATPESASVVDVAPTLLHDLGDPVPAATDGRVLTELFHPDSPPASRSVETERYERSETSTTAGDDDDGDVESRLRSLGYIE